MSAVAGLGDPVAVLPLAATEQHGPHLPRSTDVEIGRGILTEALGRLPPGVRLRLLPMVEVGASDEHLDFPGTESIGARALEEEIVRTGEALAAEGVRRLVLANSHGGNRAVMELAALRLRRDRGMLVVKASWFRFPRPPGLGLPDREWEHGLHGGAVETAMMLHLAPDQVRMGEVADFPSAGERLRGLLTWLGPEGTASFAWLAQDLNPAGVTGDARLATPDMGRALVEHYGGVLAAVIRDAADFPIEAVFGGGAGGTPIPSAEEDR